MRNLLLILFSLCAFVAIPQQRDPVIMDVTDSSLVAKPDTTLLPLVKTLPSPLVQPLDSGLQLTFKPNPRKSMLYSAIFPGLGQIYNRKYWKLPIIYGIFAGMSYAITWNNQYYQDYFRGYKDIMDDDDQTTSWHNFIPFGQTPDTVDKTWLSNALKSRKDNYRYYRDFSIIIAVAVYGLNILDAYVDAQLYDFDISPDLSLRVEPVMMRNRISTSYMASSFGLQCSLSF